MKFYSGCHTFKFSWDQVAIGFWQRYPNTYSKHVLTEDVVCREVKDKKLFTKRLLTKTNHLPKWGERFVHTPREVCIIEESVVDPTNKTFTTYTRNIGMQRVMNLEEKCVYKMSPENSKWVICERTAWINSSIFGLSRPIQAFGFERFKKNSLRAIKGYEQVLAKLFSVGPATEQQALYSKEKLRDTALKAKEMAKKSGRPLLQIPPLP